MRAHTSATLPESVEQDPLLSQLWLYCCSCSFCQLGIQQEVSTNAQISVNHISWEVTYCCWTPSSSRHGKEVRRCCHLCNSEQPKTVSTIGKWTGSGQHHKFVMNKRRTNNIREQRGVVVGSVQIEKWKQITHSKMRQRKQEETEKSTKMQRKYDVFRGCQQTNARVLRSNIVLCNVTTKRGR